MKFRIIMFFLLFTSSYSIAANFYWVGGTGNWSDYSNHWATTSGGASFHSNAPTASDDVFFDANSFSAGSQVVSIDANAYCKDMTWSGATNSPTLDFPNLAPSYYNLYIAGSPTFIATMYFTNNNSGIIYFTSTSTGKTITTNGLSIPCKFIFNGSGGEWTLQDNLTATPSTTWDFEVLTGATVISNGKTISGFGDLVVSGTGALTLTTSTANFANTATITGTVTISTGTLDVDGTFNATGGNITFSGNGNLNLGGATNTSLGTFTESTSTVTYDRAGDQGVIAETYYMLVIAGGSAIKTAAGTVNVSNNFTVNTNTTYALGATTTTVSGATSKSGTITISTGTFDAVGSFTGATGGITFTGSGNLRFGAAVNSVGTFTESTSTVTFYGATSNTGAVRGLTYYNVVIAAGTKGLSGTATVLNNFTVDPGATFQTNAQTINITGTSGTSDINGTISMSTGTFNADGTFDATGGNVTFTGAGNLNLGGATVTSLGTLTEATGTVSYDRAGAQSVLAETYYNLTIAGAGSAVKTAAGTVNVSNNLTVDASTEYALAATTTTVTGASDINGTISMSTGTCDANGTFDATGGNVTFTGAGNLNLGATITSLGTFTPSTSTVTFDGSSNQSFSGTAPTFYNLTNSNSATTVTLNQSITVTNTLAMSGTADIDMNANNIDLSSTGTITGETDADRIYDTGGTADVSGLITTTRVINAPSSENIGGMGLILTSAANMGSTVINRGHIQQTGNSNTSLLRYYSISPTTNTGLNATIIFNYFDSELNGQGGDEADLVLWRSADGGTTWSNEGGTVNTGANTVTLTGIDAFSRWTPSSETSAPLPLQFLSFNASQVENKVQLFWKTTAEVNCKNFEIEWSRDAVNWEKVGSVNALNKATGINNYTFIDNQPHSGLSYYRIKQIDFDGVFTYSSTQSITAHKQIDVVIEPNPADDYLEIVNQESEEIVYTIFDINSKHIQTGHISAQSKFKIDTETFPAGLYIIDFLLQDESFVQKFVVRH